MQLRGRTLRFAAVLMFVVLALTRFSSGRSRGHYRKSSHSSGGGRSSSHHDHDDLDARLDHCEPQPNATVVS
jgi:hypothetical protein